MSSIRTKRELHLIITTLHMFGPQSVAYELFISSWVCVVSLPLVDVTDLIGLYTCLTFNLLKTKRIVLYIRNQSVPRSKHFPPRL